MSGKDFNKGMEVGARPFEEKYREMGRQLQEVSDKIENDMDRIKEMSGAILDEMDSIQKKQFYTNNTAADIDILERGDRETLLSCLLTLAEAEKQLTDLQQLFIRSVKKYLEKDDDRKPVKWSVLKQGDWSIVETIIGIEETKAIVQALMEFLFLGYKNHKEYLQKYEALFECFNLSKKGFDEIKIYIDNLYRATGLVGIAENYGYVPEEIDEANFEKEQESEIKNSYGCVGKLSCLEINDEAVVTTGEEKVYEDKEIFLNGSIRLEKYSTLKFENCEVITSEERPEGWYGLIYAECEGANVLFENCTILHKTKKESLIRINDEVNQIAFINCRIKNCRQIVSGSYINRKSIVDVKNCYITQSQNDQFLFCGWEIHLINSIVDMEGTFDENGKSRTISSECMFKSDKETVIEGCTFRNMYNEKFQVNSNIKNSIFENCIIEFDRPRGHFTKGVVIDSIFKGCVFRFLLLSDSTCGIKFENTEIYDCVGYLPALELVNVKADRGYLNLHAFLNVGIKLRGCQFLNWSYNDYKDIVDENVSPFIINSRDIAISGGFSSEIIGCRFENLLMNQNYLIGTKEKGTTFRIENCKFINIKTNSGEIFRKSWSYRKSGMFKSKLVTETATMRISNCTGI